MMGRLARATRAAGGHTVGVIPEALRGREVADLDADGKLDIIAAGRASHNLKVYFNE